MQSKAGDGEEKPEDPQVEDKEGEAEPSSENPEAAQSAKKEDAQITDYVAEDESCASIDDVDDPFIQELKKECELEQQVAKKEKENYWEE